MFALRRVIDWIRAGVRRASSANVAAVCPAPGEGLRYSLLDEAEDSKPRCLISFLGKLPENIAEILDTVVVACRNRGEFPVVTMSELRPDLIAVNSAPIEFIPTRHHLSLLTADEYERYVRRRWSLIVAKWSFANEIELALGFDEFVLVQTQPAAEGSTYALAMDS